MKSVYTSQGIKLFNGDSLSVLKQLPSNFIHCCITSPPYYGLRDYGVDGQIGLEESPQEYINKLVEIFHEVKRVLRDNGTCWVNIGDSYAGSGRAGKNPKYHAKHTMFGSNKHNPGKFGLPTGIPVGMKAKDLIGIPWMLAFALRADGWYLRCDIIWHKPNPLPLSVTDRPTSAHEYIFLLSKQLKYFYDIEAIKEPSKYPNDNRKARQKISDYENQMSDKGQIRAVINPKNARTYPTRNKRSVWTVATKGCKGAHFAVFPPDLIKPCIMAGTSENGCCPKCRAPQKRLVERIPMQVTPSERRKDIQDASIGANKRTAISGTMTAPPTTKHLGWTATCECGINKTVPCVVLDPFIGSGTTALVSRSLGRRCLGIELNPENVELIKKRLE